MVQEHRLTAVQWFCLLAGGFLVSFGLVVAAVFRGDLCLPAVVCAEPHLIAADIALGLLLVIGGLFRQRVQTTSRLAGAILVGLTLFGYLASARGLYKATFGLSPTVLLNFIYFTIGLVGLIIGFDLAHRSD